MSDTITRGRQAWERLRSRDRKDWQDWLAVGEALAVGKAEALRAAGSNRAVGTKYNKAMGKWLKDNGLADLSPAERYKILLILEHRAEIEEWRAGLDDAKRRKLNHPAPIWAHWCRATGKGTAPRGRPANGGRRPYAGNRPICFDQEAVRRAAMAMKDSGSGDWFRLAGVALRAAIRDRGDLVALLGGGKASEAAVAPQTLPVINIAR